MDPKIKVRHLGETGWVVDQLVKEQEAGNITGIMVQYVCKDGTFVCGYTGDMDYLTRLGLLETMKRTLFVEAMREDPT